MKIGDILILIGKKMIQEAKHRIASSKHVKSVDAITIQKQFLDESCSAEQPLYLKSRSNKMSEIATIKSMLKILHSLHWKGAVYSAISRIGVSQGDGNPEPGFQLAFQLDVLTGLKSKAQGGHHVYSITNKDVKDIGRVAIQLKIGTQWVWASFDAYAQSTDRYLVPTSTNGITNDRYVSNLVIHHSPSANVHSGTGHTKSVAKGNLEIWATNYGKANRQKIPGADDGKYDFGDHRLSKKLYGCFQVHDFLHKQTLLAVNNFFASDGNYDIGIGNSKNAAAPDWTYAKNGRALKRSKQQVTLSWFFQPKSYKSRHAKKSKKSKKSNKSNKSNKSKQSKQSKQSKHSKKSKPRKQGHDDSGDHDHDSEDGHGDDHHD
jgi:hypothetical protein